MRTQVAVVAASISLILSAAGAFAGDSPFQVPTTDRAQQVQPLLSRAAHAVKARPPRTVEEHISNLWLFPTDETDTVFAQYIVTTNESSSGVPTSEEHLELLKLDGDRIVEQRDLMHGAEDSAWRAEQSNGGRDWSASLGNGHTTSTTQTSATSVGSPASAHWSASIGTGQVRDESTQRRQIASKVLESQAPRAHWTSKIGTARAADSSTSTKTGKSPS